MHTWSVGDFARIIKDGEPEYVRVKTLENDVMEATSQTTWETAVYDPATLEYIPPYQIDVELVKKLIRMEVPYSAIYGDAKPFDNARSSAPVQITLEDLHNAIMTNGSGPCGTFCIWTSVWMKHRPTPSRLSAAPTSSSPSIRPLPAHGRIWALWPAAMRWICT